MDEERRGLGLPSWIKASLARGQTLGKKGCIRERFNGREVTIPQLAMHVGELQMTVVKKRDNDSQIYKKKS